MASSINASTSGAGGVITTADNSGILNIQTAGTTAITVDASQNLLIGTTTASTGFSELVINGNNNQSHGYNAGIQLNYGTGAFGGGAITTQNAAGGGLNFYTYTGNIGSETYLERMRIDSSGNLLVGTPTTSGDKLTIAANGVSQSHIRFIDTNTSGKTWVMGPGTGSGAVTDFGFYNITNANLVGRATSAGVWYQGNNSATWSVVSDERIKENISTLNNGLSIITALRPVEFDYKTSKIHDIGFIAQEYQKVLPEQINENEPTSETKEFISDNKLLGITSNLIPYLVASIQELNAKVESQAAQIAALQAKAGA